MTSPDATAPADAGALHLAAFQYLSDVIDGPAGQDAEADLTPGDRAVRDAARAITGNRPLADLSDDDLRRIQAVCEQMERAAYALRNRISSLHYPTVKVGLLVESDGEAFVDGVFDTQWAAAEALRHHLEGFFHDDERFDGEGKVVPGLIRITPLDN